MTESGKNQTQQTVKVEQDSEVGNKQDLDSETSNSLNSESHFTESEVDTPFSPLKPAGRHEEFPPQQLTTPQEQSRETTRFGMPSPMEAMAKQSIMGRTARHHGAVSDRSAFRTKSKGMQGQNRVTFHNNTSIQGESLLGSSANEQYIFDHESRETVQMIQREPIIGLSIYNNGIKQQLTDIKETPELKFQFDKEAKISKTKKQAKKPILGYPASKNPRHRSIQRQELRPEATVHDIHIGMEEGFCLHDQKIKSSYQNSPKHNVGLLKKGKLTNTKHSPPSKTSPANFSLEGQTISDPAKVIKVSQDSQTYFYPQEVKEKTSNNPYQPKPWFQVDAEKQSKSIHNSQIKPFTKELIQMKETRQALKQFQNRQLAESLAPLVISLHPTDTQNSPKIKNSPKVRLSKAIVREAYVPTELSTQNEDLYVSFTGQPDGSGIKSINESNLEESQQYPLQSLFPSIDSKMNTFFIQEPKNGSSVQEQEPKNGPSQVIVTGDDLTEESNGMNIGRNANITAAFYTLNGKSTINTSDDVLASKFSQFMGSEVKTTTNSSSYRLYESYTGSKQKLNKNIVISPKMQQIGDTLQIITQNYHDECTSKMNFQMAQVQQDNQQNVKNYRYHLGDQKHKIRTKNGKVKNVKKVDYGKRVLNQNTLSSPKAGLGAASTKTIAGITAGGDSSAYEATMKSAAHSQHLQTQLERTTIIFNNQELEPKELDYSACSQHFKVNKRSQFQKQDSTRAQTVRNRKMLAQEGPLSARVGAGDLDLMSIHLQLSQLKTPREDWQGFRTPGKRGPLSPKSVGKVEWRQRAKARASLEPLSKFGTESKQGDDVPQYPAQPTFFGAFSSMTQHGRANRDSSGSDPDLENRVEGREETPENLLACRTGLQQRQGAEEEQANQLLAPLIRARRAVNPETIENLKAIKKLRKYQAEILQRGEKGPKTHQEKINEGVFAGQMSERAREYDKYYPEGSALSFQSPRVEATAALRTERTREPDSSLRLQKSMMLRTTVQEKLEGSVFRQNEKARKRKAELRKKCQGIEDDYYEVQARKKDEKNLRLEKNRREPAKPEGGEAFLQKLNKHIRHGIQRLRVDEQLRQRLSPFNEHQISSLKDHNKKLRSLSRLKQLSETEQKSKFGELNRLLLLPEITGDKARGHGGGSELALLSQEEASLHGVIDHQEFVSRLPEAHIRAELPGKERDEKCSLPGIKENEPVKKEKRTREQGLKFEREIGDAATIACVEREHPSVRVSQAQEEQVDHDLQLTSYNLPERWNQGASSPVSLHPELIFDEPQRDRIQLIFQNIEALKATSLERIKQKQLRTLANRVYNEFKLQEEASASKYLGGTAKASVMKVGKHIDEDNDSQNHSDIDFSPEEQSLQVQILQLIQSEFPDLSQKHEERAAKAKRAKRGAQTTVLLGDVAGAIAGRHKDLEEEQRERKRAILETVKMLDESMRRRIENKKASKQSQLQFIKDFIQHGADTSIIDREYVQRIEMLEINLRKLIGPVAFERVQMEVTHGDSLFEKLFKAYEQVQELKDGSKRANALVARAKPATHKFINKILERRSVESSREKQTHNELVQDQKCNQKDKTHSFEFAHSESLSKCIKCAPEPEPLSPRTVLGNQQTRRRNFTITAARVPEGQSQDAEEVEPANDFQVALGEVFPEDLTIGEKYIVLDENLFVNEDWLKQKKKIYRAQFLRHLKKVFPIPFFNEPKSYGDPDDSFEEQGYGFSNPLRFYIELRDQHEDLDEIFAHDAQKEAFYEQARGSITTIPQDHEKAMLYANSKVRETKGSAQISADREIAGEYYSNCNLIAEVPVPTFAKIVGKTLVLASQTLSERHALVLKQFLVQSSASENQEHKIEKLVIDDCALTDKSFAAVLEGLWEHRDHIQQVTYSQNDLGPKSIEALLAIMRHLAVLQISNVNSRLGLGPTLSLALLQGCLAEGQRLQKLSLAQVNLSDRKTVRSLCQLISTKPFISHLDISWASLGPNQLMRISRALKKSKGALKDLNLSYNSLDFNQEKYIIKEGEFLFDEYIHASYVFVQNICDFISKSTELSHLDLSGLGFGRAYGSQQLVKICKMIASESTSIQSFHLNDNAVNLDKEAKNEIEAVFKVTDLDFQDKHLPPQIISPQLGKFLKQFVQSVCNPHLSSPSDQIGSPDIESYLDHIISSKVRKQLCLEKLSEVPKQIECQTLDQTININSVMRDKFVVTRSLLEPELTFCSQVYSGRSQFKLQDSREWSVKENTQCMACQKHKYVIIFFDEDEYQNNIEINKDLIEIKDQELLDRLDEEFFQWETPVIMGTFLERPSSSQFQTKQKMMPADIFTLLSLSQDKRFVSDVKQSDGIKQGCLNELNKQNTLHSPLIQDEFTKKKLQGWQRILFDKCNFNFTMDIKTINQAPNMFEKGLKPIHKKGPSGCQDFIYAAYMPPGHHQFLIYSPKTQRAYCKQIFVDIAKIETMAAGEGFTKSKAKRSAPNIWSSKQSETDIITQAAITADFGTEKNFSIEGFLKEKDDPEECKTILQRYSSDLQNCFIENISKSDAYPRIDFEQFGDFIEMVQDQSDDPNLYKLVPADIDLIFIRVTRNDTIGGSRGSIGRAQFLEALLRIAQKVYGSKVQLSSKLEEFIELFVKASFVRSSACSGRKLIQASRSLNLMLFDNDKCLKVIFNEHKDKQQGFTLNCAFQLLESSLEGVEKIQLTDQEIKQAFVFSKSTVKDEERSAKQYESLQFVDFDEFLCRLAIKAHEKNQPYRYPGEKLPLYSCVMYLVKHIFAFQKKLDEEKEEKKAVKLAKFIAEGGQPPTKKPKARAVKRLASKILKQEHLKRASEERIEVAADLIRQGYLDAVDMDSEEEELGDTLRLIPLADDEISD